MKLEALKYLSDTKATGLCFAEDFRAGFKIILLFLLGRGDCGLKILHLSIFWGLL
jgi:hypothetical protein